MLLQKKKSTKHKRESKGPKKGTKLYDAQKTKP